MCVYVLHYSIINNRYNFHIFYWHVWYGVSLLSGIILIDFYLIKIPLVLDSRCVFGCCILLNGHVNVWHDSVLTLKMHKKGFIVLSVLSLALSNGTAEDTRETRAVDQFKLECTNNTCENFLRVSVTQHPSTVPNVTGFSDFNQLKVSL